MAYSYKGAISFGLVYIPIKLEASVQSNEINFNQLEKKTQSRVRYKKTCEDCDGKTIDNKDIVKAYQYEKDKYVIFDDADFEKLKTEKEKTIVIEQFVDLDEIDPIFYNKPFYVIPTGAEKAYCLLKNSMEKENKVGIAKTVLGQKETLIAIRVRGGEMLLNTLYFADEIKRNTAKDLNEPINKQEQEMAAIIIKNMTKPFDPKEYKDEYNEKIKMAIEAKIAGKDISAPKEKKSNVIDLMEALKQSVAQTSGRAAAKIQTGAAATKKTIEKSKTPVNNKRAMSAKGR